MSRYIDADKLMRQVENLPQKEGKVFRISVYNLITFGCTADVVEVVRCKDCFYSHFNSSSERYTCQRVYPRRWVEEDDFCNYGRTINET